MCQKTHWGGVILASVVPICSILLFASLFVPWYMKNHSSGCGPFRQEGFCEHDSGDPDFVVSAIYVNGDGLCNNAWEQNPKGKNWCDWGIGAWCGGDWDSAAYRNLISWENRARKVDEEALDSWCSKAKASIAFAVIGSIILMTSAAFGCMQCCCDAVCFTYISLGLSLGGLLCILIHLCVMAAGKDDFDTCCRLRLDDDGPDNGFGTKELFFHMGIFCDIVALILCFVASISGCVGSVGIRNQKSQTTHVVSAGFHQGGGPVVIGQVVS